ncbi:fibronectin type III domain-containing protein [Paenibacillus sp. CC-CFT747]|nr:fibronectin type III domain-containing protein [Paenibacillus sp. CC-CFT747]
MQESSLKLSWTKPTSYGGAELTGYRLYKDGALLQEIPATASTLALNGLQSDSRYTFQVQAGDSAGRWSTDGPLVTVRMPGNEIVQVKQGHVFVQPESAQFKVRTGRSSAQWIVEDAWGREVKRGSSPVAGGELLLSVPVEQRGYFTIRFSLEAPGLEPVVLSTPFAVLSPFDVKAVPESPFGFATHLHRTGTGWGPDLIDLIQASGAKNVRDGIEWNGIEKQKGQYTFAPVPDNYMAKLKERQEDMLFVAGYNNPLYDNNSTPYTDEGRQGFADYAKSYFDHYGTQLKWLEVYNEFNIAFGDRGNGPADSRPDYYYPF